MNTNEILEKHGLDFTISKRQLFDDRGNDTPYFGLFNDKINKCINTVKDGYVISQNAELVEMLLEGIKPFGDDLKVTKAGSINDGCKTFLQLAINGVAKVGNDIIEKYVTVIDSNDGSTALSIGIGDITMSCQNQFFKFYKAGEAKFRHSSSLEVKIKSIPRLIEVALEESIRQIKLYQAFQSTEITRNLANEMVNHLLGYDRVITSMTELSEKSTRSINKMDKLYNSIDSEIADKGLNLWGLHSGVTKFTTHELSAPSRDNGKIENLMLGTGYHLNKNSLAFAELQLA